MGDVLSLPLDVLYIGCMRLDIRVLDRLFIVQCDPQVLNSLLPRALLLIDQPQLPCGACCS